MILRSCPWDRVIRDLGCVLPRGIFEVEAVETVKNPVFSDLYAER
jgi:hypothetical protein